METRDFATLTQQETKKLGRPQNKKRICKALQLKNEEAENSMNLQSSPNGWSCLPTSFAMVVDIPVSSFISMIGHDGSERPYASKNFRAGFHEQECIRIADILGYSCTPFEAFPRLSPFKDGSEARVILFGSTEAANIVDFYSRALFKSGVITGRTLDGIGHAVAWDGHNVYDPRDKIYPLKDADIHNFLPRCFWKIEKRTE